MTPRTLRIAVDRRFRRRERRRLILAEDQQVAAADRLLHAEGLLHEELALHHRDPPVALAVEQLARLKLVAEMAQLSADDDSLGRLAAGRRSRPSSGR